MEPVRFVDSLLDTGGLDVGTYWVVYLNRQNKRWWNRYLAPGFQHVQLWKQEQYGPDAADAVWIRIDPGLEYVDTQIVWDGRAPWDVEPHARIQRVTLYRRSGVVREYFSVGPMSCVELVKAHLGISSWLVRTPLQLWKYLKRDPRTISY